MLSEIISREHSYMVRLLLILDQLLDDLKKDKKIDYRTIHAVISYLQKHSEQTHHPKEDILYHYYLKHYGENSKISDLEQEHKVLSGLTQEFAMLVSMVLQDAVVPKDVFIQQFENFIYRQKMHLDFEEREILPHLKRDFQARDWENVNVLWGDEVADPIFGSDIQTEYQQLASLVLVENLTDA